MCACNGQTYSNACEAHAAGQSLLHPGACAVGQICGTRGAGPCPAGQYCDFPDNACGAADGPGTCAPRPENCAAVFDPVCACDGQTYSNLCAAAMAGVDVVHAGECNPAPGACGLPAETGPCNAAFQRWYFNADAGQCEQFVWGGCGGNANNFETLAACEAACPPIDRCADGPRTPIVIAASRTFGECIHDCVSRLTFGEVEPNGCDGARLEVCSPGGACVLQLGRLTPVGHARIRALAAALVGVNLDAVYGCPDCADGGAAGIDLLRGDVASNHIYEYGHPPVVLADADTFLQGLITSLAACQSTPAVTVDPACVPR